MNILNRFFKGKLDQVKDWQNPDREETPMPCPEITLDGIDKDLYAKLLAEATEAGIEFNGSQATIHEGPILLLFDWNYDSETRTLHVTCLKKPFLYGCGAVETQIRELVQKAKGAI